VATPPAEAGILMGVTRAAVLFLAERLGMEVAEEPITPERLLAADECFLTGTGAEIIAAIRVDGKPVGSGTVGPVTQQLLAEYRKFIHTDEVIPYIA
jgi:branched-chain amino acid aminotransferase